MGQCERMGQRRVSGQGRSEKRGEAAPAGLNKLYSSEVGGSEGGELVRSISCKTNAADACGRRGGGGLNSVLVHRPQP